MLGSASSLTGCSWIPVFYMERLPIWPPQPSYWATRYLLVRLDVRLSGFWLSVTTVKDLRMTAGTNGFTCFPRHGGVTPPTSKLRATTEKFLMEKPNNTFCPTWESNPGPRKPITIIKNYTFSFRFLKSSMVYWSAESSKYAEYSRGIIKL